MLSVKSNYNQSKLNKQDKLIPIELIRSLTEGNELQNIVINILKNIEPNRDGLDIPLKIKCKNNDLLKTAFGPQGIIAPDTLSDRLKDTLKSLRELHHVKTNEQLREKLLNLPPKQPTQPTTWQANDILHKYDQYLTFQLSKGKIEGWGCQSTVRGITTHQRDDLIDLNKQTYFEQKKKTFTNLQLMELGNAPIGADGKSIELHHSIQSQTGGMIEMSNAMHQTDRVDMSEEEKRIHEIIHINYQSGIPSGIDGKEYKLWKEVYWENRALQLQLKQLDTAVAEGEISRVVFTNGVTDADILAILAKEDIKTNRDFCEYIRTRYTNLADQMALFKHFAIMKDRAEVSTFSELRNAVTTPEGMAKLSNSDRTTKMTEKFDKHWQLNINSPPPNKEQRLADISARNPLMQLALSLAHSAPTLQDFTQAVRNNKTTILNILDRQTRQMLESEPQELERKLTISIQLLLIEMGQLSHVIPTTTPQSVQTAFTAIKPIAAPVFKLVNSGYAPETHQHTPVPVPIDIAKRIQHEHIASMTAALPATPETEKLKKVLQLLEKQFQLDLLVETILSDIDSKPVTYQQVALFESACQNAQQHAAQLEGFVQELVDTGLISDYKSHHPGVTPATVLPGSNDTHTALGVDVASSRLNGLDLSTHDEWFLIHNIQEDGGFHNNDMQQILAELTRGIYLDNAYPFFSLEPGIDKLRVPLLHPAYRDTKVGNLIMELDYYLKAALDDFFLAPEAMQDYFENHMTLPEPTPEEFESRFECGRFEGLYEPFSAIPCPIPVTRISEFKEDTIAEAQYKLNNMLGTILNRHYLSTAMQLSGKVSSAAQKDNVIALETDIAKSVFDIGDGSFNQLTATPLGKVLVTLQQAIHEEKTSQIYGHAQKYSQLRLIAALSAFLTEAKAQGKMPVLSRIPEPDIPTPPLVIDVPTADSCGTMVVRGGCALSNESLPVTRVDSLSTGTQIAADYLKNSTEPSGVYNTPDESRLCLRVKLEDINPQALVALLPKPKPGRELLDAFVLGDETHVLHILRNHPQQIWQSDEKGATPLHYAVRHNMPGAIQEIVNLKGPLYMTDVYGNTALDEAGAQGKTDLIKRILSGKESRETQQFTTQLAAGFKILESIGDKDQKTSARENHRQYRPKIYSGIHDIYTLLQQPFPGCDHPVVRHHIRSIVANLACCLEQTCSSRKAFHLEYDSEQHLKALIELYSQNIHTPVKLINDYGLETREQHAKTALSKKHHELRIR